MEEKKDQRVTIMMSESELEAVDRWAHENRIKSRGEAVRQLLSAAQGLLPALKEERDFFYHYEQDADTYRRIVHKIMMAYASVELQLYGQQETEEQRIHRAFDEIHSFDNGDVDAMLDIMDFAIERPSGDELNERELFVLERIDEGLDDEVIANMVGISERTMQSYIKMLCAKTGAPSRTELPDFLPVPPVYGAHLPIPPFKTIEKPPQFYFGNKSRKLKLK